MADFNSEITSDLRGQINKLKQNALAQSKAYELNNHRAQVANLGMAQATVDAQKSAEAMAALHETIQRLEHQASTLHNELVLAQHQGQAMAAKYEVAMKTLVANDGIMAALHRQLASVNPTVGSFQVQPVTSSRALEAVDVKMDEVPTVVSVPPLPLPVIVPPVVLAAPPSKAMADLPVAVAASSSAVQASPPNAMIALHVTVSADVQMDEVPTVVSVLPAAGFSTPPRASSVLDQFCAIAVSTVALHATVSADVQMDEAPVVVSAPLPTVPAIVCAQPPLFAGPFVFVSAAPTTTVSGSLVSVPASPLATPSAVGAAVSGLILQPTKALMDAMNAAAVSSTSNKTLEDK
jgi:hypothetical protein